MHPQKRFIILGAVVGSLLLLLAVYLLRPQGTVTFTLAPDSTTLTINDKVRQIAHNQRISLQPGTYTLLFSREGFESRQRTITVKNKEEVGLTIALMPLTEEATKIINDSSESRKIIDEFKKQEMQRLFDTMPINGVGFKIEACPSVRKSHADVEAVCIDTSSSNAEVLAKNELTRLGYDLSDLEILVGKNGLMTILKSDTYAIETYGIKVDGEMEVYITPLNVPVVAYDAPINPQLENIRTQALNDFSDAGYDAQQFHIVYSNSYLGRYNPIHDHFEQDGAHIE